MKKGKKITLIVLVALLVAVGSLCYWQRNNLEALRLFLQLDQEDISTRIEDNVQKVTNASQKVAGVTVRDLTDEEKAALRDQSLSREELIAQITTPAETVPDSSSQIPPDASAPGGAPAVSPQPDPDREALSRLIAEVYLMKEEYNVWLENMNQAAIDEYVALPEEKQTPEAKYSIGMRYMNLALDEEKVCDARMASLESSIRELLKKLGEDTSLADEIHAAYLEEKALKKAYYLNLH